MTHVWPYLAVLDRAARLASLILAAMFMLVVLDPPVRSTLDDGSIVYWQGGDNRYRLWLLVKLDDGRTVGVGSQRMLQPTKGERVVLREQIGRLDTSKFFEVPTP
jgi:hypothetical protein